MSANGPLNGSAINNWMPGKGRCSCKGRRTPDDRVETNVCLCIFLFPSFRMEPNIWLMIDILNRLCSANGRPRPLQGQNASSILAQSMRVHYQALIFRRRPMADHHALNVDVEGSSPSAGLAAFVHQ